MDLVLEELSAERAGRVVVGALSFRLPAGTVAELRGPNGVGKSTLIRTLAGLGTRAGGDAQLGPISLAAEPARFQDRLAYAGHLDAVKPQLTVAENLALWAAVFARPAAEVAPTLARFGIARAADQRAGTCSAGQKRRLGLARLALADRALWLLDEPTVSLDADGVALVAELLAAHARAGGIALVATHVGLGLAEARRIELAPRDGTEAAAAGDPFLAGAWG